MQISLDIYAFESKLEIVMMWCRHVLRHTTHVFMLHVDTDATALPCDWSGGAGKLAPFIQGSPPTVTTNTDEECRDQCISQSTFICATVNYKLSDRTCELLAENNQTASVVEPTDDNWQHYIRPICAGK